MSTITMLYLTGVFIAVFGVSMLLIIYFTPSKAQQRLKSFTANAVPATPSGQSSDAWIAKVARLSSPLAKLSIPDEGQGKSSLRRRFMNAGFRGEHVPTIYFGAKTLLAALMPVLVWFVLLASDATITTNLILCLLLLAAAIGFYLPNFILTRMVARRQREIFESFPDALDLLTICIEAGLTIDAAIARVAEEMVTTNPIVSEELHLVTLELRAGNSKEKALRNLAMRTGVEDMDTLASMLIQAEQFGTSIGDSLRVQSDHLRTRRRQIAEEAAAKIAMKLLFPLIFCIFPALMLIMLGPAVIQIYKILLPSLAGQ